MHWNRLWYVTRTSAGSVGPPVTAFYEAQARQDGSEEHEGASYGIAAWFST